MNVRSFPDTVNTPMFSERLWATGPEGFRGSKCMDCMFFYRQYNKYNEERGRCRGMRLDWEANGAYDAFTHAEMAACTRFSGVAVTYEREPDGEVL